MAENIFKLEGGPYHGLMFPLLVWPPPERLTEENFPLLIGDGIAYRLVSKSKITDEQAAKMPNVARGALYKLESDADCARDERKVS